MVCEVCVWLLACRSGVTGERPAPLLEPVLLCCHGSECGSVRAVCVALRWKVSSGLNESPVVRAQGSTEVFVSVVCAVYREGGVQIDICPCFRAGESQFRNS